MVLTGKPAKVQGTSCPVIKAEEVGFEPTKPYGLTVFKTAAFNRSATPPFHKTRVEDAASIDNHDRLLSQVAARKSGQTPETL